MVSNNKGMPAHENSEKAGMPADESIQPTESDIQLHLHLQEVENERDAMSKAFEEQKQKNEAMRTEMMSMRNKMESMAAVAKNYDKNIVKHKLMVTRLECAAEAAQKSAKLSEQTTKQAYRAGLEDGAKMQKRTLTDATMEEPPAKKAKHGQRSIPCTKCFVNGVKCSSNTQDCTRCIIQGKASKCQRVCCKKFKKGTCKNKKCQFAHEGDGCTRVIPYCKLKVLNENAIKSEAKTKMPDEDDKIDGKDCGKGDGNSSKVDLDDLLPDEEEAEEELQRMLAMARDDSASSSDSDGDIGSDED